MVEARQKSVGSLENTSKTAVVGTVLALSLSLSLSLSLIILTVIF
jgi:hypothetical protein